MEKAGKTFTVITGAAALAVASLLACTPKADDAVDPGGAGGMATGGKPATGGGTGGGASAATGGSSAAGGTSGTGGGAGGGGGSNGGSGGGAGVGGAGGSGAQPSPGDAGGDGPADAPAAETPAAPGTGCGVPTKFCDDWESQEAGKPPAGDFSVTTAGGGSIVVDTAQKFSGAKSLHVKGGSKAMLLFTKQFPLNDQHGRLMLYMPKKPTTSAHWDIIQSHSPTNHWELGGQAGGFELVVDPPDNGIDSQTPFPEGDKWYCIQWNFKHPGDTFIAKLDGVLVKPSPVVGRWKSGTWRDLTIGWQIFGSSAADFWIDDLAFGEQEIPCPTK